MSERVWKDNRSDRHARQPCLKLVIWSSVKAASYCFKSVQEGGLLAYDRHAVSVFIKYCNRLSVSNAVIGPTSLPHCFRILILKRERGLKRPQETGTSTTRLLDQVSKFSLTTGERIPFASRCFYRKSEVRNKHPNDSLTPQQGTPALPSYKNKHSLELGEKITPSRKHSHHYWGRIQGIHFIQNLKLGIT